MYHVPEDSAQISHLFDLFIATPEKKIYEAKVISLKAPGADGFFEVLVNHASFLTILKEGKVVITDQNKNQQAWQISGGYFEISKNKAYLLADRIENVES